MAKNSMYKPVESCMGIVEYFYEGKKTPCSGSMIFAGEKALIATAAHCIYDWKSKTFYDEIFFKPYILHMKKRYKAIQAFVPRLWGECAAIEYDTGFLVVEDDIKKDFVYSNYAVFPIFCHDKKVEFLCGGFSYNPLKRGKPYFFKGVSQKDIYFNSFMQGIYYHAKNGMSGGPWITLKDGKFYQNSLTSFTNKENKNMVWGPYWGSVIEQLFEVAARQGNCNNNKNVISFNF